MVSLYIHHCALSSLVFYFSTSQLPSNSHVMTAGDYTKQSRKILLSLFEYWGVYLSNPLLFIASETWVNTGEKHITCQHRCLLFKQPEGQVCLCVTSVLSYYR